jgi:hypothetical protein
MIGGPGKKRVFREVVAVALAIVIFLFAYFFNQLPYFRGELTTSDTIADSLDKSQLLGILIKKNPFLRSTIIIGFFFSAVLLLFKSSRRAGARFAVILFIIVSLLLGYFSNLEQPGIFILVFGLACQRRSARQEPVPSRATRNFSFPRKYCKTDISGFYGIWIC